MATCGRGSTRLIQAELAAFGAMSTVFENKLSGQLLPIKRSGEESAIKLI